MVFTEKVKFPTRPTCPRYEGGNCLYYQVRCEILPKDWDECICQHGRSRPYVDIIDEAMPADREIRSDIHVQSGLFFFPGEGEVPMTVCLDIGVKHGDFATLFHEVWYNPDGTACYDMFCGPEALGFECVVVEVA